ncbi:MAG: hypothetical protein JXB07_15990 [Anaerolineae bacterium]|nr:hypothetical protein [Anaerolineae bacterium]
MEWHLPSMGIQGGCRPTVQKSASPQMGLTPQPDQRVIGAAAGSMPTQAAERSTRGSPADHRRIIGEGLPRVHFTQAEAWLACPHRRTRATADRPYDDTHVPVRL